MITKEIKAVSVFGEWKVLTTYNVLGIKVSFYAQYFTSITITDDDGYKTKSIKWVDYVFSSEQLANEFIKFTNKKK